MRLKSGWIVLCVISNSWFKAFECLRQWGGGGGGEESIAKFNSKLINPFAFLFSRLYILGEFILRRLGYQPTHLSLSTVEESG